VAVGSNQLLEESPWAGRRNSAPQGIGFDHEAKHDYCCMTAGFSKNSRRWEN
jgi:hypothetical protein